MEEKSCGKIICTEFHRTNARTHATTYIWHSICLCSARCRLIGEPRRDGNRKSYLMNIASINCDSIFTAGCQPESLRASQVDKNYSRLFVFFWARYNLLKFPPETPPAFFSRNSSRDFLKSSSKASFRYSKIYTRNP